MKTTWTTAAIAAGAVALTLLAGCSSGGGTPTGDATLTYEDSPLNAYWEKLGGSQDETDMDAQMARSEEIVAACMQDEGFEYTPQDNSGMTAVMEGEEDMPAWDSLEFAEQYGYGATTSSEMPMNQGGGEEWVDPNADYLETMSESEQQAFYEALYGKQTMSEEPTDEETAEVQEYDWTTAGCQGKAQHEVYEAGQVYDDPEFKDLMSEMNELYEDSRTDERTLEAYATWAECMAEAGYDFAKPEEAQQSIYDLTNEIPYDEETGEQDPAALAELRDQEIETAVADRTCQDSTGAGRAVLEAQFEIEQEFIDAHKDELDAMVAKAAQSSE
ncbi:hypothetical protein [uncultured Cellulomonas sp.]|uniref:hypothetical protein n=1 Tax=uncultured Cellulomonas sp. TaxID=189682 RepID=UPI0028EC3C82|nr:hypothetical protein [uncultured Cellulomonas sp.]